MKKKFCLYLAKGRKRRLRMLKAVLWLISILRDVEYDEMNRYSDLLLSLDSDYPPVFDFKYSDIEKEEICSEYIAGILFYMVDEIEDAIECISTD